MASSPSSPAPASSDPGAPAPSAASASATASSAAPRGLLPVASSLASAAGAELSWASLEPDASCTGLRGGMGTVFRARWARRGKDVAVKLLRASELSAEDFAGATAELEREAAVLRLASEGGGNTFVVPLFGVARGAATETWAKMLGDELPLFKSRAAAGGGVGGGGGPAPELLGLVMAWQAGGTLSDQLHGAGRASWLAKHTAERLLLLERAAEGVALLHSAQPMVVHGDIKSDNVLLTMPEGEPRLSDFGIAQIKQAVTTSSKTSKATGGSQAAGTWTYMAPEMYRRKDVQAMGASRATDVFALATLCWEGLRPSGRGMATMRRTA